MQLITQSKKQKQSLVYAAMIGQNLKKGFDSVVDDSGKRSILLQAYVETVRAMVTCNEAGETEKAQHHFTALGRLVKLMDSHDAKVTAKRLREKDADK